MAQDTTFYKKIIECLSIHMSIQSLKGIFFNVSKKYKVNATHFLTMLFYGQLRLHFMIIEYQLNHLPECFHH